MEDVPNKVCNCNENYTAFVLLLFNEAPYEAKWSQNILENSVWYYKSPKRDVP